MQSSKSGENLEDEESNDESEEEPDDADIEQTGEIETGSGIIYEHPF